MDQPVRFPWDDFPDVLIHAPELFVKRHASYAQAKAGDAIAAAHLVMDSLADGVTNRLILDFDKYSPGAAAGARRRIGRLESDSPRHGRGSRPCA